MLGPPNCPNREFNHDKHSHRRRQLSHHFSTPILGILVKRLVDLFAVNPPDELYVYHFSCFKYTVQIFETAADRCLLFAQIQSPLWFPSTLKSQNKILGKVILPAWAGSFGSLLSSHLPIILLSLFRALLAHGNSPRRWFQRLSTPTR